jgi:hypothetical protein
MKYILALILSTLALAAAAPTADLHFIWNANPPADNVTKYRIYEIEESNTVLRAEVPGNMTNGVVAGVVLDRRRTYVCRAVNAVAESANSNPAYVDAQPSAPTGVKIQVVVTVTVGGSD